MSKATKATKETSAHKDLKETKDTKVTLARKDLKETKDTKAGKGFRVRLEHKAIRALKAIRASKVIKDLKAIRVRKVTRATAVLVVCLMSSPRGMCLPTPAMASSSTTAAH